MTVRLTMGSVGKAARLVEKTENPALQNAEIEWKSALKSASSGRAARPAFDCRRKGAILV